MELLLTQDEGIYEDTGKKNQVLDAYMTSCLHESIRKKKVRFPVKKAAEILENMADWIQDAHPKD